MAQIACPVTIDPLWATEFLAIIQVSQPAARAAPRSYSHTHPSPISLPAHPTIQVNRSAARAAPHCHSISHPALHPTLSCPTVAHPFCTPNPRSLRVPFPSCAPPIIYPQSPKSLSITSSSPPFLLAVQNGRLLTSSHVAAAQSCCGPARHPPRGPVAGLCRGKVRGVKGA